MVSEFRYCKLQRNWVLFAPNRQRRPSNYESEQFRADNIEDCPFEAGSEHLTPHSIVTIKDKKSDSWDCRVVPNLYNALSIEVEPKFSKDHYNEKANGYGAHEVLIETPYHDKQMYDFSVEEFENYFRVFQNRVIGLQNDSRIHYLSLFKNCGKNAGATLSHSHSQLIGTPFIPTKVMDECLYKENYFAEHNRALMDDILYEELEQRTRIITSNEAFVAYCPYASRFAFEVCIAMKRPLPSLAMFNENDIENLATLMSDLFRRLKIALGEFPFNMVIKNTPFFRGAKEPRNFYRFHISIMPRLYRVAGFELDSGMYINTMMPEKAAKVLKEL